MSDGSSEEGRLPNFLIVGAAKAGTTTLYSVLRNHPEVFMPVDKEPEFFDRRFDRGLDWYRRQFAGAGDAKAVGEATPSYLADAKAIDRIAEVLPKVRIVALLRNPIDRAYSHYWHVRGFRAEPRSFEEAIAAERRGEADARPYLGEGRYAAQLRRWKERFPNEQLLVRLFEDLRDEPRVVFRDVATFLGVDPALEPPGLGERYNQSQRYRSVRLRHWQVKYHQRLHIPEKLALFVNKLNHVKQSYPPLDPAVRARLADEFAGERRELSELLGRDLSAWER
jgi:hypothetical protein